MACTHPPRHTHTHTHARALQDVPHRYVHLINTAIPSRVAESKNLPLILRPAMPDVYDELSSAAQADPASPPVHIFPEVSAAVTE